MVRIRTEYFGTFRIVANASHNRAKELPSDGSIKVCGYSPKRSIPDLLISPLVDSLTLNANSRRFSNGFERHAFRLHGNSTRG